TTGAEIVRPFTPTYVALMVVLPVATPVSCPLARPLVPIVAAALLLDAQVTLAVTSWVELSTKVTVAVKRALVLAVRSTKPLGGLITRDRGAGAVTVRLVVTGVTVPDLAVTMVGIDDGVTAVALSSARFPPGVVTLAILVSATDHSTTPLMSRLAPLLKVPMAIMRTEVSLTSL